MELTAQMLADHIAQLNNSERPDGDQRRQARLNLDTDASIIPLAFSETPGATSVSVRDLSSAGIGFLHEHKMRLDEEFALVLPQHDDTPALVLCQVIFWQPIIPGLFAIGARFVRVLRNAANPLPLTIQPAIEERVAIPLRKAS